MTNDHERMVDAGPGIECAFGVMNPSAKGDCEELGAIFRVTRADSAPARAWAVEPFLRDFGGPSEVEANPEEPST